jgi:tetratricopeptide (TPR) repeat protein
MPRDLAIQQETLRLEMMMPPAERDWGLIERLCRRLIEMNPENVRAHSHLGLMEFEQYNETTGKPTPDKDKSRERVLSAREHLQAVKNASYYPIWRTLDLEARIQLWLARRPTGTPAGKLEGQKEEERLRKLLFDPEEGILTRAKKKDGFTALSSVDIDGLRGLHQMAVRFGVDQARNTMGSQADDLFTALRATQDLANNLHPTTFGKAYRATLLLDNMALATEARKYLGSQTPEEWPGIREGLEKLARQAADAGVSSPMAFALLAQLLNNDAFLEGKKGNGPARKELETRALSWIDEGLKLGREAGETGANLVELYGVGLEILLAQNAPAEKIKPYLDALKKINDNRANAIVGIQEAAMQTRQGKFALAKASLEALLKNDKAADLRPRALTLLANVRLSTADPVNALAALRELEAAYAKVEELTAMERAFMLEFLLDPRDIAQLIAVAELETALEKLSRYYRDNPRRTVPDQGLLLTIQNHERSAVAAIGKLANKTDANRKARVGFANYYLRRGLYDLARQEVEKLKADYPSSVEALRLEVALALVPDPNIRDDGEETARRQQKADALINAFISNNPAELAGKLFWAEWLIRTGRSAEAMSYLEDPKHFPGERDETSRRMLAISLLQAGKRDEGVKMLGALADELPNDRGIELLLIQTAANPRVRDDLINSAMAKHENNGSFRLLAAQRLMADDKYAEAADIYWQTQEFTRVRGAAQSGLLQALLALARTNPDTALETVEKFMKEAPNEPVLYGVAAEALMKKDEFGTATDSWDKNKTMYGALNAWAAASKSLDIGSKMLFRAKMWLQANRPDRAWEELEPIAAREPYNEAVLVTMVDIAMMSPDNQALMAKGKDYLNLLKQLRPESPGIALLDARFSAKRGDPGRAVAILEGLLDKNPKYVAAYPELIQILNVAGQGARAAEWNARWLKIAPGNPIAEVEAIRQSLAAGKTASANEAAEAFIIETEDRVRKRYAKTADPDMKRVVDERVRAARAAAELALAQTWQQTGELDGATRFIERSLKDDPKSMGARVIEAQLAIARKDWPKAKELYEAILKDDKNNYEAKTNLAWLLAVHLNKPEEGLKMIRDELNGPFSGRPIAVERLNPDFLNVVGAVLAEASRKKIDAEAPAQMKSIFEAASRRYPTDPRVFAHLGEALNDLAEKPKASVAFQNALRLAREGKGPLSAQERRDLIQKLNDRMRDL